MASCRCDIENVGESRRVGGQRKVAASVCGVVCGYFSMREAKVDGTSGAKPSDCSVLAALEKAPSFSYLVARPCLVDLSCFTD